MNCFYCQLPLLVMGVIEGVTAMQWHIECSTCHAKYLVTLSTEKPSPLSAQELQSRMNRHRG